MATNSPEPLVFIFDYKDVVNYLIKNIKPYATANTQPFEFVQQLLGQAIPDSQGGYKEPVVKALVHLGLPPTAAMLLSCQAFNMLFADLSAFLPGLEELLKNKRIHYEIHTETSVRLVICQRSTV